MNQDVFNFFQQEHDLILLESDLDEIERVVSGDLRKELDTAYNDLRSVKAENERLKTELARYQWRKIESEKDLPEASDILYEWQFRDCNFMKTHYYKAPKGDAARWLCYTAYIAYREAVPFED